jgi:hypothetical protein
MAKLNFTTDNIKRVPINRNNIFYSEESFAVEGAIGKNYIEQGTGDNKYNTKAENDELYEPKQP